MEVLKERLMITSWARKFVFIWKYYQELWIEWKPLLKTYYENPNKLFLNVIWRLVPPTLKDVEESVDTFQWMTSPIRSIIYHPTEQEIALLTGEATVKIFKKLGEPTHEKVLKQPHICAAFRPRSTLELAIGCAGGICMWQVPRMVSCDQMIWLSRPDIKKDFVIALQWFPDGIYLASVVLALQRIQIWRPHGKQLMQQVTMPRADSYLWILRYPTGMQKLYSFLETDVGTGYRTYIYWEHMLTGRKLLQTASWTACGNHLLYVEKNSSMVYASTPNWEVNIFVKPFPKWITDKILNLAFVKCGQEEYECGPPQAIAIDPFKIFVAFIFKERPFVLLCQLDTPRGCKVILRPLNFIKCTEDATRNQFTYPICMSFSGKGASVDGKRVLAVAWSTGYLQTVNIFVPSSIVEQIAAGSSKELVAHTTRR